MCLARRLRIQGEALIGCTRALGAPRSVFRGVKDGENAPRYVHVCWVIAAHAVVFVVEIDFPENVIAVACDLELKGPKGVIAVGVVAVGELREGLHSLHDDGFGGWRQVGHAARHHDLTGNTKVSPPSGAKPVVLFGNECVDFRFAAVFI